MAVRRSMMSSPIAGVAIAASGFVVAPSLRAACCTTHCLSSERHRFEIDGSIARKIARSEVQAARLTGSSSCDVRFHKRC